MNKDRRLTCIFVLLITVIVASAIVFVGYTERFLFIVPGIVFIMFTVAESGIICQACCEVGSRRWPKTVGYIRRADIVRSYIPAGGMHAGNSSSCYAYSLVVDYDYSVGGKRYNGSRVSFVQKDYGSWKEADCARRFLLKNKSVDVYFCSQLPSVSCISHVKTREIAIKICGVAAICAVSLMFTLLAFYYLP